jgi:hypothetical protein
MSKFLGLSMSKPRCSLDISNLVAEPFASWRRQHLFSVLAGKRGTSGVSGEAREESDNKKLEKSSSPLEEISMDGIVL